VDDHVLPGGRSDRHPDHQVLPFFAGSCFLDCTMDATTGHDQLVLPQVLRAIGQPLVVLTLTNLAVHRMEPANLASASSLYNMSRILGGAVGTAVLASTITWREHFHSARIGESVAVLGGAAQERLSQLAGRFLTHGGDQVVAQQQAVMALDRLVRREAYVMAYADARAAAGRTGAAGLQGRRAAIRQQRAAAVVAAVQ
jgi:DHA2 family multidrug resistance protein